MELDPGLAIPGRKDFIPLDCPLAPSLFDDHSMVIDLRHLAAAKNLTPGFPYQAVQHIPINTNAPVCRLTPVFHILAHRGFIDLSPGVASEYLG